MKSYFLISTSVSAVLATVLSAGPAIAQTTDTTPTDRANASSQDEIIVTGTKREQSLVDVPVSMTVLTADAIENRGIDRPSDFLSTIPNVTFIEDNAGEVYINIRGQTSVRNSDPNVAIVIDGVTLSSVKPFNQDLFDIEQIEVLKGPQSALYGRNAAAGAIVITTKKPGDVFEGNIEAGVGNFDSYRVSGGIGGPLSDAFKFNVAGSFRETDGPFTNVTTGEKVHRFKTANARGRLIYEPNDALSVDFRLGGHTSKGGGSAYNAQLLGNPIGDFDGTALDANLADMPFVSNVEGAFDEDFIDATLNIKYDFNFATLNLISGANKLDQYFASDSPPYIPDTGSAAATVQQYTYKDTNLSQEIRLTSPSEQRFRWQVGGYILQFDRDQFSNISIDSNGRLPDQRNMILEPTNQHPSLSFSAPVYETTSYAPFASVQYDFTDKLELNLAGRYDIEKRSIKETAADEINPLTGASYNNCVALTGRSIDECELNETFKQFEPKASLTYKVSPNASIYGTYGKGFKSGGFNPIGSRETLIAAAIANGIPADTVFVQDRYEKEVSESFELGAKAALFNNALNVNAAIFHTDISGAQQFQFFPSVGLQTTVSIDKIKVKGFDFDFQGRLPTGTNIYGGFGYTDGKVKEFAGNPAFEGNRSPGAFKTTLNLGIAHPFDIGNGFELEPRAEFNNYGSIWWDVANSPGTERDSLSLFNGRLSLKSDAGWTLSAWGDNLTNEKYFQEVVPLLGVFTVNYRGPTRSYGIEARYDF